MQIKYITFTEKGIRRYNQDVFKVIVSTDQSKALFVVCDGMGGHAMGDVASKTVCDAIASYWENNHNARDCKSKVIAACKAASSAMDERADKLNRVEMGTTLVLASIEGNKMTIAHCGDSRCYLLRGDEVVYRTEDHVGFNSGLEVVTKCFFSYRPDIVQPDIKHFELQSGDRIFLCSDGVYKSAAPEILAARLMDDKPLEDVVDVIKFLCEKFSDDNYTGVLVQVDQTSDSIDRN